MFLTATETKSIRVTLTSICEAYELSVAVVRPYLVRALRDSWTVLVWATATAYALGMVARDCLEWGRPYYCQMVDAFVARYEKPQTEEEYGREAVGDIDCPECQDRPIAGITAIANRPSGMPTAKPAPKRDMGTAPIRRTLVDIRKAAIAAGVRGAGRMNLKQLAALGYV